MQNQCRAPTNGAVDCADQAYAGGISYIAAAALTLAVGGGMTATAYLNVQGIELRVNEPNAVDAWRSRSAARAQSRS